MEAILLDLDVETAASLRQAVEGKETAVTAA